ncbi:MAG: metallophosphoesterase [Anaerolineaceae bacterium]
MPLFSKKPKKAVSRLFYATDIHGSERTYRKFINAGKFYDVNVLILGGDISGKLLIPIIKETNGKYRATLQGVVQHMTTEEELKAMIEKLGILGFYHQIMEEDEVKAMQADPQAVDDLFHKLARKRLDDWINLAETRLKGSGIKCFVTGGNDDDPAVLEAIHKQNTESFFACEGQVVYVDDDHSMISVGYSTPTPWNTPREIPDEKLWEFIEEMVAKVPDMDHAIFNFHDPPRDSTLDTCPMLDWNTNPPTPIVKSGQIVMHGAGSQSVRRAIETYQPMLGLHGHIHESQAVMKIGRTTCINPGSEYGEGFLRGCLINISDGNVESFQMTNG